MTKCLTTLCLLAGGILPVLVDVNPSHLLNPDWDSHNFFVGHISIMVQRHGEVGWPAESLHSFWFCNRNLVNAFIWRRACRRGHAGAQNSRHSFEYAVFLFDVLVAELRIVFFI